MNKIQSLKCLITIHEQKTNLLNKNRIRKGQRECIKIVNFSASEMTHMRHGRNNSVLTSILIIRDEVNKHLCGHEGILSLSTRENYFS